MSKRKNIHTMKKPIRRLITPKKFISRFKNNPNSLTHRELNDIIKNERINGMKSRDTKQFKIDVITEYIYTSDKKLIARKRRLNLNLLKPIARQLPYILRGEHDSPKSDIYTARYVLRFKAPIKLRTYTSERLKFNPPINRLESMNQILMDIIGYFIGWEIFDIDEHDNTVANIEKNLDQIFNRQIGESGYIKLVSLITKTNNNPRKRLTRIYHMKLNDVLFNKLSLNIKSNNDIIKDGINCVSHYINTKYPDKRNKKFKQKVTQISDWTVNTLCDFLKDNKKQFICYDRNVRILDEFKLPNNQYIFRFMVSNEHLYPLDPGEITPLKKTYKYSNLPVTDLIYIKDLDKYSVDFLKYNKIVKIDISIKKKDNNDINNSIDNNDKSTDNNDKYDYPPDNNNNNEKLRIFHNDDIEDMGINFFNKSINVEPSINKQENHQKKNTVNKSTNITDIMNIVQFENDQNDNIIIDNDDDNDDDQQKSEYYISKFIGEIDDSLKIYTSDEVLYNEYIFLKKIFDYSPLSINFSAMQPLLFLCHKHKLYSTFIGDLNRPAAIFYNNPDIIDNLQAIDKTKCYSYILSKLEKLPILDVQCVVQRFDKNKMNINLTRFYHVKYLTGRNMYNGYRTGWVSGTLISSMLINKAITLDAISHFRVPRYEKNIFSTIIKKMIKTDPKMAKTIINKFIGMMSMKSNKSYIYYTNLTNSYDEITSLIADTSFLIKLKNNFYVEEVITDNTSKNNKNMLPINTLIVDTAVVMMINMTKQLKLLDKNVRIRSINTDGITFSSDIIDVNKLHFIGTKLKDWRTEQVRIMDCKRVFKRVEMSTVRTKLRPIKFENIIKNMDLLLNRNVLFNCYAGCGKTYFAIQLIKYINKYTDSSYLVIGNKYSTLGEYMTNNMRCRVIQYFLFNSNIKSFNDEFKSYDYIIIDECGLFGKSEWTYIYENIQEDQYIIALGDHKQLSPINWKEYRYTNNKTPLETVDVLNFFQYEVTLNNNYRNNYSNDDYNKMLSTQQFKYTDHLNLANINRVSKRNICITRKTMNKMNTKYTETWIESFADMKVKRGEVLISEFEHNQNKTKQLIEMGLYNGMYYTIKEFNNSKIILSLSEDYHDFTEDKPDYELTETQFKNMFNYSHCITLYRAQGASIPDNEYGIHEIDKINNNPRFLYTALSRRKIEKDNSHLYYDITNNIESSEDESDDEF
jgi:hypothetical protein